MTGRCGHRPLQIIGDNVIETVSGRLTGRETRPLQTTNRDVLSAGYIPGNILQRRNLNREFIHDVRTAKIRRVAVRPRRLTDCPIPVGKQFRKRRFIPPLTDIPRRVGGRVVLSAAIRRYMVSGASIFRMERTLRRVVRAARHKASRACIKDSSSPNTLQAV